MICPVQNISNLNVEIYTSKTATGMQLLNWLLEQTSAQMHYTLS